MTIRLHHHLLQSQIRTQMIQMRAQMIQVMNRVHQIVKVMMIVTLPKLNLDLFCPLLQRSLQWLHHLLHLSYFSIFPTSSPKAKGETSNNSDNQPHTSENTFSIYYSNTRKRRPPLQGY